MLEKDIEHNLLDKLEKMGYKRLEAHTKVDYIDNISSCLSKVNNCEISKNQVEKIIDTMMNKAKITQKYAYTFNEYIDTNIDIDGKLIKLVDKENYDNNILQISSQIVDINNKKTNRYDITIFMNGFPIVDIELKNYGVSITQAVNQINRYIDESFNGLFKFIQLYIVSNETETRYAVNNNSEINNNFLFTWSDRYNVGKINLNEFTNTFLTKENLIDMITKFMLRQHNGGARQLKVLRPYQVFAIRSVIERITNDMIDNHDGYIFHTTGSGKTITSWKCVQLLSEYKGIDKVIFLVDRRDLDEQTYENFASYDSSDIDKTENTNKLIKHLNDNDKKYIITTVQKMNSLVTSGAKENIRKQYENKRVVFIVDECHRSQSGNMHLNIRDTFKNSNYIGFTGTPIFEVNQKSSLRLTSSVFGDELHCYKINNAIGDKNVLDFDVTYYSTAKKKEQSKDKIYYGKVTADNSEAFHSKERMKNIVKTIFELHNVKTQDRRYTALFTVDSIEQLIDYYKLFGEVNKQCKPEDKLRVSAIFTTNNKETNNEDGDGEVKKLTKHQTKEAFNNIIRDFNKLTGNHVKSNDKDLLRKKLAEALNSKPDQRVLDIVIVVKIFMTGFDSPMTNTLYVDRSLDYHELIQSFSRTNRIESNKKKHGNIVSFRTTKEQVDEAIKTFNDNKLGLVLVKSFEDSLSEFVAKVETLLKLVGNNTYLKNRSKSEQDNIIEAFKEVMIAKKELKDHTEFNHYDISKHITNEQIKSIHEQIVEVKASREKTSPDKVSIIDGLDFQVNQEGEFIVDTDYIKVLLEKLELKDKKEALNALDSARQKILNSDNIKVKTESDMINAFLDKLVRKIQKCSSNKELANINPIYEWKVYQFEKNSVDKNYIAPCEDRKIIDNRIYSIDDNKINNDTKYINICVHSGAYLYSIFDRLYKDISMISMYRNKDDRRRYILENQIYGVAATDEEAIIARKKLYGDPSKIGNIIVIENLQDYFTSGNLGELVEIIKQKTGVNKFDMVIGKPDGETTNYSFLAFGLTGNPQNIKLDI